VTFAIAAAGTGGHVFPALSVADALVELGAAPDEIMFLGGDRFEAQAVPDSGFPFKGYQLARLRRAVSLENLRIPMVVRRTAASMAGDLRMAASRVVLGMGGYVTVPASLAARRAGLQFFLQEQNALPGLATRFAARRALTTFLGLPGRAERLPRSEIVGNPLRPAIAAADREALRSDARSRYGVERAGTVVGILGGSLGARVLNQAAPRIARLGAVGAIVHLTGPDAFGEMSRIAGEAGVPWSCRPFEAEMEYFYAAADLVVCRAGAMTVSELAATGTPAVLVPLERVAQQWNTRELSAAGGALVVRQGELGRLPDLVGGLLGSPERLGRMSNAARAVGRPHAARIIARRLMEAAGG
jgi:UDP-N-acetylglucosamine--N-acetylmuramyl-(pentapeptide) pyrophosphoryl-undecaprenol N-acetylglucosamine transferase